jgi:hypothetical protein
MIDIEATLLAIVDKTPGHEVAIYRENGMIVARTTNLAATWIHKAGKGSTVYSAVAWLAEKLEVEAPQVPNLCEHCGLELDPSQPFDGHRECREQE